MSYIKRDNTHHLDVVMRTRRPRRMFQLWLLTSAFICPENISALFWYKQPAATPAAGSGATSPHDKVYKFPIDPKLNVTELTITVPEGDSFVPHATVGNNDNGPRTEMKRKE